VQKNEISKIFRYDFLALTPRYVFYLDEDYNTRVNYFAGKEESFSDDEAECRTHHITIPASITLLVRKRVSVMMRLNAVRTYGQCKIYVRGTASCYCEIMQSWYCIYLIKYPKTHRSLWKSILKITTCMYMYMK
jgi:hypothetical protein